MKHRAGLMGHDTVQAVRLSSTDWIYRGPPNTASFFLLPRLKPIWQGPVSGDNRWVCCLSLLLLTGVHVL